jgi:hypothetical protein
MADASGFHGTGERKGLGRRVNDDWLVAALAMYATQQALGAVVVGAPARRRRMSEAALSAIAANHGGCLRFPGGRLGSVGPATRNGVRTGGVARMMPPRTGVAQAERPPRRPPRVRRRAAYRLEPSASVRIHSPVCRVSWHCEGTRPKCAPEGLVNQPRRKVHGTALTR